VLLFTIPNFQPTISETRCAKVGFILLKGEFGGRLGAFDSELALIWGYGGNAVGL
jgi:hypothetical protein